MARHNNPKMKVAFEVPDIITVGMRLRYMGVLGPSAVGIGLPLMHYINLWNAAKGLITKLDCEYMTMEADLETETDPRIANAVMWVGLKVSEIIYKMEKIPKN